MTDNIKTQMLWAIDNIPPWDDFWLDIKDKYVLDVLPIEQGKATTSEHMCETNNNPHTRKYKKKPMGRYKDWNWNPEGKRKARTGYGIR